MNVTAGFSRDELESQPPPLNIEMVLPKLAKDSLSMNWLQWKFPLTSMYFGSSPRLLSASSKHSCSFSTRSFASVYGKWILKLEWGQRMKVVRETKVKTSSQISRPAWDQEKTSSVYSPQLVLKVTTLQKDSWSQHWWLQVNQSLQSQCLLRMIFPHHFSALSFEKMLFNF